MTNSQTHLLDPSAPAISVIVPVYNVCDHVLACLQSIQRQTWTDFEVIVVDDGSTDSSGELVAQFCEADPRFHVISQQNRGLSGARNTGLDVARADVISFVDSDDRIAPQFLERLYLALQDSGSDWISCAMKSCFADGTWTVHSTIYGATVPSGESEAKRYGFSNWSDVICHFPSAWNKLYRRSLIGEERFDEGMWFEDHSFFQRLAARTDHILHLPLPLYLQTRGRVGQITTSDSDRVFEQFDVLRRLDTILREGPFTGAETAFAEISSRLICERSLAVSDPVRRTRFAACSAEFLRGHGLSFSATDHQDIAAGWALEMAGELPLSVCILWQEESQSDLQMTLESLATQFGVGFETVLICSSANAASEVVKQHPNIRIFDWEKRPISQLWQELTGRLVNVTRPGVTLEPNVLAHWANQMLQNQADLGLRAYHVRPTAAETEVYYHDGFVDLRSLPSGAPESGAIQLAADTALALAPELSARMFDRRFLVEQSLFLTKSPRSGWALQLGAAVLATQVHYERWPGISVPQHPQDDGALSEGHSALVNALPTQVLQQLPSGWQRRLFDRAVRAEVLLRKGGRGVKRVPFLLGAMFQAARFGFAGITPEVASFDAPLRRQTDLLFDPFGVLRWALKRPRARSLQERQADLDARVVARRTISETQALWAFPTNGESRVTCIVDFTHADYANFDFVSADRLTVPAHFSLRQKENSVVFNQRDNNDWGEERSWTANLPKTVVEVTIHFADHRARLLLDGIELCEIDVPLVRGASQTAGLDIALIRLQGKISPVELLPSIPTSDLHLTPRLVLQAAHPVETHQVIEVNTKRELLATAIMEASETAGLQALVPGRLWRDVSQQETTALLFQLQTKSGDPVGQQVRLTRQDMAQHIDQVLQFQPSRADSAVVLAALEHIHHANLFSLLSDKSRELAQDHAAFFNLENYLEGSLTETHAAEQSLAAKVPARHPDPETQEVDSALACFAKCLETGKEEDPVEVVSKLAVSSYVLQSVYLRLSEFFARHDQNLEGFFALVSAAGNIRYAPNGHPWHDSAVLPFLFLQGDIDQLAETVTALAEPGDDWIVTPTLAWVMRCALRSSLFSDDQLDALLSAYMAFISNRATDYWDRVHCRELTLAAVELAVHHQSLSGLQSRNVLEFVVRIYGLSRLFWDLLEQREDGVLSEELSIAKRHFADLHAYANAPADADRALRFFQGLKCPDVARVRREIFGPAELPLAAGKAPTFEALGAVHEEPALPALRYMAAPNSVPVDRGLSKVVADHLPLLSHLPSLSDEQETTPYLALKQPTARDIAALLAEPDQPLDPEGFDDLMQRCQLLGDYRSKFLGIALRVVLIEVFSSVSGKASIITRIAKSIGHDVEAFDETSRTALRNSTPVQMALASFHRNGRDPDLVQELVKQLLGDTGHLPMGAGDGEEGLSGSPLYDAIVVVFSCKPHLNTRIPALRQGWLRLLEGLGVPYVIVVGDGDGRKEEDVVHLDAPDNYEGLPQKTLAAIQWVHSKTRFAHMVKVDDDCFLNAPLFFQSLNYRKFDYYGRRLSRGVGQLDRVWHQQKSATVRGRMDLDKSPEPSTYADGGSGYALSRKAMAEALSVAQTPAGQELIQVSFMEDKLLGDLLALRGISVKDEGYTVTVRRRMHGDGIPVPSWQNGFNSSLAAPVHFVHMDTIEGQQDAVALLDKPELTPKKIWPSYQAVRLGYQSNALELVSPEARLHNARHTEVALVACMRNEMFILPQFLQHYRKLGIGAFLIADNASDDGTLEYLAEQPDVSVFSVDTDYRLSHYGVAWQQALLAEYRVNKWSLVADADELLVWQAKQTQTLPELLAEPDFSDAEAVRLFMLDMYPKGPLEDARFTGNPFDEAGYCDRVPFLNDLPVFGPFSDGRTWTSALRHRLIPGSRPNLFVAQKLALLRYQPWMRLSAGLHYVGDARLADRELILAHFKYNADFRRKAQTEVARRQHFNDAEEYRKYLALASEGRSVIYDSSLSAHWTDTAFAQKIFDAQIKSR